MCVDLLTIKNKEGKYTYITVHRTCRIHMEEGTLNNISHNIKLITDI